MGAHTFGGDWTEQKLDCLGKYLSAYTKIFSINPRARYFTTMYVDAFAGTGSRLPTRREDPGGVSLFPEDDSAEVQGFLKGSARVALEVDPPFDRYHFVEQNATRANELNALLSDFPERAPWATVHVGDAGPYLTALCSTTDWRRTRAVVFLDPYGMQVDWALIEAIGATRAIDLWVLFPLGVAVNRLLTRASPPTGLWANRLTRLFGTDAWEDAFYECTTETTLFGPQQRTHKTADLACIGRFFVERLRTVFPAVTSRPLPLRNSRNNPLYLLCFAAGNPSKGALAARIAQQVIDRLAAQQPGSL